MSDASSTFAMRLLGRLSWFMLGIAVLASLAGLFSVWAVNAEALGAHNFGLAIFLSIAGAFAMTGSTYAVPALALVGILLLFVHRDAGLRLLAAAVASSIPMVVLTVLERI